MAKKKSSAPMRSDMTCPPGKCGPMCLIMGLLASVIAAVGLCLVVGGIMMQWSVMSLKKVLAWYTGGLVLWCIAKCAKAKACPSCR